MFFPHIAPVVVRLLILPPLVLSLCVVKRADYSTPLPRSPGSGVIYLGRPRQLANRMDPGRSGPYTSGVTHTATWFAASPARDALTDVHGY